MTKSTSLATPQKLKAELTKYRDALEEYLPKGADVDSYIGGILEEFDRTHDLFTCRPATVFASVRKAALLGLPLGQGLCYLVPYKTTCTFQLGYRGMLHLARECGAISRHVLRSVHDGDVFDFNDGLKPWVKHERIAPERIYDNMTHVYVHFLLPDSQQHLEVMSRSEVEAHKQQYVKATGSDSPWQTNPLAMAKKTVIRRAFAGDQIPITQKIRQVIAADEFNQMIVEGEVIDSADPDEAVKEEIRQKEMSEAGLFEKHEQGN